ncbi:MAG: thioredoxin domain-containing protein [Myxococcales bacterium]|nr:thioredoxin domain-containing protein [Myxococcota bacterium]MDW8283500.1 thioredoxin domain-containing protein [Myxococcales bacterium]
MLRLCLALLLLAGPGWATPPQEHHLHLVRVGRDYELLWAPAGPLPVLGPRRALVTLDLFQPLDTPAGPAGLVLSLTHSSEDVRLVYHPVATTPAATRGAEVAWEALGQQRLWPMLERLYQRPELLLPEREPALLEEAARIGLDAARLREALVRRRHRATVEELWRRDRDLVLASPEVWVNGRRLQGNLTEIQLRDEIERQRERAQALLRQGVPLSELYDRLLQQERERSSAWARLPPWSRPPLRPVRSARTHFDLAGSPSQGPTVAPVVIVFFASFDGASTRRSAEIIRTVMQQQAGRVRLVIKHLPTMVAGQQAAWFLQHLHARAPDQFWRAYESLLQAIERRHQLSAAEVVRVLRNAGLNLDGIPPEPTEGPVLEQLEADRALARRLDVEIAPAVVINGRLLRGSLTLEMLEEVVRRELNMGLIERLREGSASRLLPE